MDMTLLSETPFFHGLALAIEPDPDGYLAEIVKDSMGEVHLGDPHARNGKRSITSTLLTNSIPLVTSTVVKVPEAMVATGSIPIIQPARRK